MYSSKPLTYTIQPVDTPYKLAKTYGITVSQILAMNPSMNPNFKHLISYVWLHQIHDKLLELEALNIQNY